MDRTPREQDLIGVDNQPCRVSIHGPVGESFIRTRRLEPRTHPTRPDPQPVKISQIAVNFNSNIFFVPDPYTLERELSLYIDYTALSWGYGILTRNITLGEGTGENSWKWRKITKKYWRIIQGLKKLSF